MMKVLSHRRSWMICGLVLGFILAGIASNAAFAGPTADLDQCRNGSAASPNNCLDLGGGTGWVNGNVGSSGAHLLESYSIPYRVVMKNLPLNTSITLTLGYDIKHSDKHAIDYLTHYNRLEPHFQFGHAAETIDPKSGVSGVSTTVGTFTIPAPSSTSLCNSPVANQPTNSFNALSAGEKLMTLFGGTITGMAYVSQGCLTDSTAETEISVTFTVDSSTAILAFGGHIASRGVWGLDKSAANINGSPYHMQLIGWSLGSLGGQDRSLSAGAVLDPCEGIVCTQDACETKACVMGQCVQISVKDNTTLCRESAGVCDVAEYCDGLYGSCPADGKVPQGTVCRESAGVCDVAEVCNGTSNNCPADGFLANTFQCRESAGVCDVAEFCTGSSAACPADTLRPTGYECRATAGVCDIAETCTGSSATCPADAKSTAVCRTAAGVCDVAESCNGVDNSCPADALRPAGYECRAAAGVCDIAETCTGSSATCPADAKSTAVCRIAAGICDVAEFCNGVSNNCPPDAFKANHVECRASAGACDPAEFCTGSSASCPADAKSTAVCRNAAGLCDVPEFCDGVNNNCPADTFKASNVVCRASVAACDIEEKCSGTSPNCPPDSYVAAGTQCRDGDGLCNPPEMCTGSSGYCPGDITFLPNPDTCTLSGVGVCRTAGFWGTHGGTEKNKSINITQMVIDFALYNLYPTGPLNICGEKITTTKLNDAASALEALCVPVQGNQYLQLARQLTAAALNCAVSGYHNCVGYPKYEYLFSECNTWCDPNTPDAQTVNTGYCIQSLDCLNNGGTVLEGGYCKTGTCSDNPNNPCNGGDLSFCGKDAICVADVQTCHDQPLCLHVDGKPVPGAPCFPETGPAGSSNACQDANKTACTVIGPGEGPATTQSEKKYMCWVDSAP